ncbi:MAG: tetratricopeptide repeat protein [Deltaproteobacteria bacterium]|jgi:TolA-binding protein|nr:tetratricopeptide repeat protein [Deltaproteobacteria bacterium]
MSNPSTPAVAVIVGLMMSGALMTSGCLQTRSNLKEQEEKQVLRKQVVNLQQTTADVSSKFNEVDEDLRKTNGRIEALDARMTQIKDRAEKNDFALESKFKEQDTKFQAFREELQKMQAELLEVKASNSALQAAFQAGGAPSGSSGGKNSDKNPFELGDSRFEQKAWREAIFAYEDYRKSYPKGKNFGAATYKIGVCFQELGMLDDAKPFYDEVISKFPKSKEADRARSRLKAISKKK